MNKKVFFQVVPTPTTTKESKHTTKRTEVLTTTLRRSRLIGRLLNIIMRNPTNLPEDPLIILSTRIILRTQSHLVALVIPRENTVK